MQNFKICQIKIGTYFQEHSRYDHLERKFLKHIRLENVLKKMIHVELVYAQSL